MTIAHDTLSLVFIGCFLFGILFLIIAALAGGISDSHGHAVVDTHHGFLSHFHLDGFHGGDASHGHVGHGDAGHGGDAHHTHGSPNPFAIFSYINPTSIVLFLLGFGLFGYIFHNNVKALPLVFVLLLASLCGLIIAACLLLVIRRLVEVSESSTVQDVSDRTGLLGKVSLTIQENSLGEILYSSPGGMRKSIPARSVDGRRIERDQEVVVVNYQRGIAEVDTWDHFVNQDESSTTNTTFASQADELAELKALLEKDESQQKF